MNKRRRVLSIILGVCISLMMVGTAFATPLYEIIDGETGTYVKKSMKDHVITIQVNAGDQWGVDLDSVTVDGKSLDQEHYTLNNINPPAPPTQGSDTTTAPPPTENLPEESPTPSSEPSEVPATPEASQGPVATGNSGNSGEPVSVYSILQSLWSPMAVHAEEYPESTADPIICKVTLKGEYLETLSVGKHDVTVNLAHPEKGSVTAKINVVNADSSDTNTAATTTPSSDDSSKSKPQTGDDTSGIMGFAVAAILSGAALVVLGRKKVFK